MDVPTDRRAHRQNKNRTRKREEAINKGCKEREREVAN